MSDYLIHYGVKGMKWGVRKQRPYSGHSRLHRAYNAQMRDAADLRKHGYNKEADAVEQVAAKTKAKIDRKEAKPGFLEKRLEMRRQSLKAANYQKYSRKNNPVSAFKRSNAELKAYRQETKAMIKRKKTGKQKINTALERWGNEPMTILGITGTAETTRKKYWSGIVPGNGLY